MMKKRIILADDEPLISILMKEIIEEDQELEVSHIATKKSEFLSLMDQHSFDAAIIDISMGGRESGMELLQMMKDKAINSPVIMLSAHDELQYALKSLQAGAMGYINKKYICTDVVKGLKQVFSGNLFVSGDRGGDILKQYKKSYTSVSTESL